MTDDELRTLAEAATPGPWYWDLPDRGEDTLCSATVKMTNCRGILTDWPEMVLGGTAHNDYTAGIYASDADRAYIQAVSPEVVLGLLDRLAKAERLVPESVTRVDIIAPRRQEFWADYWGLLIQDDGRTLILAQQGDGEEPHTERDRALVADLIEYHATHSTKDGQP